MKKNYLLKCILYTSIFMCGLLSLKAQLPNEFQQVDIVTGLSNATTFKFAPDGRIFIVDRYGELLIYKPDLNLTVSAGTIPVFHELEDGLLGIAFDPNFEDNNHIFVHYSPSAVSKNRVSRFTMNGDVINFSSEIIVLEWDTQRDEYYHSAGDMDFDSQGNLYIATGDNSNHSDYAALNETDENQSAENTSSNTNDLRGKILRIKPQPNGTYTIPAGNLFPPGTPNTKPEIYVMGARNPYRIFVDKENTDWLFWGEVGPDANYNDPGNPTGPYNELGPEGRDEINLVKQAGNYGWPYFAAENIPYQIDYLDPPRYYDPVAPQNLSVWNTGMTNLPPAQPSWLDFFHRSWCSGPRYYYDGNLTDPQRLPSEFDEIYFYFDFNRSQIWAVKMDSNGDIISNERFASSVFPNGPDGFLDIQIGPDGFMYILAYGSGCPPCDTSQPGTGKLIKVLYTGDVSNSPPLIQMSADKNSGTLPLTVNFSSAGTSDPDGDSPLSYSWDFNGDGTFDSSNPNPQFIFTEEGNFNVQLKVEDGNGGIAFQNLIIYAGNTRATFNINYPPNGALIGWYDDVSFDFDVIDSEDGTTSNGTIDCADVKVTPALGHLNHTHNDLSLSGCPQTYTLDIEGHDIYGEADLFFAFGLSYQDNGGLVAQSNIMLHPKRKEAEYFDEESGTTIIPNTDNVEGGSESVRVDHNGYIVFSQRNLINIESVKYRVASSNQGGTIELRLGSASGQLLATTSVPNTGGTANWVTVESTISDPGTTNDLYFVFKNSNVQQAIFDLNYVEFVGGGASIDSTPPLVNTVKAISNNSVLVEFSEYMNSSSVQNSSNFSFSNGVSIVSVQLQEDNRTVLLETSNITTGQNYSLNVSNAQNESGLAVVSGNYTFSLVDELRLNSGGSDIIFDGKSYLVDTYYSGGTAFSSDEPIAGTTNDELYQTERYGVMTYEIPVPNQGEFDIRLHFAEIFFGLQSGNPGGGVGSRIFNVAMEGNQVLTNFDILSETAPATALIKDFDNVLVTDGSLTIQFTSVVESPKISGIEVLAPGTFNGGNNNDAKITITSPINGWDVNQPFEVAFRVENWVVNEGDTHLHYYVNDVMVDRYYGYDPIPIDGLPLGENKIRIELFNADHTGTGIYDEVTVNVTGLITCNEMPFPESWQVHEYDENPYTAVYTFGDNDLNGDGLKDIVTGGWWYANPGFISNNWQKNTIGGNFGNVVHVYDFDDDGDLDLLGTALGIAPDNEYESAQLVWAQNDGKGNFTVFNNIPAGDTDYNEPFLAGIAGGVFENNGPYRMAINWNGAESTGSPVQMLTPPSKNNVTTETWSLVDISNDSSGEDIQAGDIDRDGDLDLFQGVNWLRNNGNLQFETFSTGITYVSTPDRAQLADFDRDGDLDAVVGQLSLGGTGNNKEFAWFAAPSDPTKPWVKNILDTNIDGSLSVFAIDIDFDGDKDIVVGEWRGEQRLIAFENDLCDSGEFNLRVLDDGSLDYEHHDGARVVDIDSDGDLDVISNGWLNDKILRIYENTTVPISDDRPIVNAGADQTVVPGTVVNLNGSGSDPDGGELIFAWSQISGPEVTFANPNSASTSVGSLQLGTFVFRLTGTDDENDISFDEVSISVSSQGEVKRLNSGGGAFAFGGISWSEDQYSNGGQKLTNAIEIANTQNDVLYQTERYSTSGNLVYEIPVSNGTHSVNLHFAEIYFGVPGDGTDGGAGSRVFNIDIEGQGIKNNYDIFVAAGGAASAIVESFNDIEVNDGNLTITLIPVTENPKISGIEIVQPTSDSTPLVEAGENIQITLPNNSVVLTGTGSDPDGGPVSFLWEKVSGPSATLSGEDTAQLNLSNLQAGVYVFRLTVTDDENEFSSDQVSVTVVPENGLLAVIDATPNEGEVPLEVTFTGSNSMGEVSSYLWDFKDGQSSTDANPVHTFDNIGTYEVELTVTDMGGNQHTSQIIIAVLNIGEGNKLGLVIRKNPVTEGILGFRIDNEPDDMKILGVNLHDQQGKLVNAFGTSQITVKGDGSYELIVDTLTDGLYFLRLALNTGDILNIKILVDN